MISQFTLYADTRKGRRPSFTDAAPPNLAAPLVVAYAEALRTFGLPVATGVFGAMMRVALINDGHGIAVTRQRNVTTTTPWASSGLRHGSIQLDRSAI